jgi:hypothetical protein
VEENFSRRPALRICRQFRRASRRDDARIPAGRFGAARALDGALLLASDAGRDISGATYVVTAASWRGCGVRMQSHPAEYL